MIDKERTEELEAVHVLQQPVAEKVERLRNATTDDQVRTWRAFGQLDSLLANHGWVPTLSDSGDDEVLEWLRSRLFDESYSREERLVVVRIIDEFKQRKVSEHG